MKSENELIEDLLDLAFAEDIGDGDHTTLCCIPSDTIGKAQLLIKEDGILAGVEIAKRIFHKFDPEMKVEVLLQDGTPVKKGTWHFMLQERSRLCYKRSVLCLTSCNV